MYMPTIFGENLFDNWMNDFPFNDDFMVEECKHNPLFGKHAKDLMKTDIRENDNGYEMDVDLPGFDKSEIKAELNEGYLTISAAKGQNKEEKDKKGRMIRQERYTGSMTRSFYVGDGVKQEDINAKYENGILKLSFPKKELKEEVPEKKYIAIEG
jgi:HSP20 family protein